MQAINHKDTLQHLLHEGATVITPNNRLSSAILHDYFYKFPEKTIVKPQCLPYNTLLTHSYKQLGYENPTEHYPKLLTALQCQHVWKELISSEEEVTYTTGLKDAVLEAWERCEQWNVSVEHPSFQFTMQTKYFQKWWRQFQQRIEQMHAVHELQIVPCLIRNNYSGFTKNLVWACFDEFTPQQLTLQNYLEEQGHTLYQYDLEPNSKDPSVCAAEDDRKEYAHLISWLKLKMQTPNRRVAVVIPDLQNKSQAVQRKLLSHFEKSQFNISLGQSLITFHLVSHALTWINLNCRQLSNHQAALLLQSPYLGQAKEEFIHRSQCLQESDVFEKPIIPFKTFIAQISKLSPKLAELLKNVSDYPEKTSIIQWIDLFQDRLNKLGFPGDYGLSSEQYQCFNRFASVFDELRQLHLVKQSFTQSEALEALLTLVENTIFQAQTINAPIQILGMLEASGCEFDSIWVMGLTDQCLPQTTRLSAFIPSHLQKDLCMPRSLPERELAFAKKTLRRLQSGSNDTVFSYAKFLEDTPCLPCTLISEYPIYSAMNSQELPETVSLLIQEDECYEIPVQQAETISGGTSLLSNQAKCPFKAFAEHRLKAKPIPQSSVGIDDRDKGTLVHKVLELFWRSVQHSEKLRKLNPDELHDEIHQAIEQAMHPLAHLSSLIREVEYKRLMRIVLTYLDWEKQRQPFSIGALEENHSIQLAGLDFNVRVDRIDLAGQSKWIIDYKSSLPSSKPWSQDRPLEPQLLLYALLDEQINTLLFIQLKTGKIQVGGFSEVQHDFKEIVSIKEEEHWEDYRQKWRTQLNALADEFQKGHCPPQPESLAICQHCNFQQLCRFQANRAS